MAGPGFKGTPSGGGRGPPVADPMHNGTIVGLMCYVERAFNFPNIPVRYVLGKRSCTILANGGKGPAFIEVRLCQTGDRKFGWVVFFDDHACSMSRKMREHGVKSDDGEPAVYARAGAAAILAKLLFKITE